MKKKNKIKDFKGSFFNNRYQKKINKPFAFFSPFVSVPLDMFSFPTNFKIKTLPWIFTSGFFCIIFLTVLSFLNSKKAVLSRAEGNYFTIEPPK